MKKPDDLLTVSDVARLARVHSNTVGAWVKKGILQPAVELPGGAKRFRRSDVEQLLVPGKAS
jgi:excisionase family DNA binding protein